MALSIDQLTERVAARLSETRRIGESTIRSARVHAGEPFAVYYFELTSELPRTLEALTDYQDRVIGRDYFDGKKSLQWNNYLFFVATDAALQAVDVRKTKQLIERDRKYARKFVISEQELNRVLRPPTIAPSAGLPSESILTVWTDRLAKAGLESAVLVKNDMPTRLRLIEEAQIIDALPRATGPTKADIAGTHFVRSIDLKQFRKYPLRRKYQCGAFNLIVGANGTGKTSLLEAIELYYCGRNKRNPGQSHPYEIEIEFSDSSRDTGTAGRELQLYRDRNLKWYGQSELKTTHLYKSFSQYNFLDTDAAVSLATTPSNIEQDLSKLLVGPDASAVWRDIERVHENVEGRWEARRDSESRIKEELADLEVRVKAAREQKKESDSIAARLKDVLGRLGGSLAASSNAALADQLLEVLTECASVIEQASSVKWVDSPVSIRRIREFHESASKAVEQVESQVARLEQLELSRDRLQEKLDREGDTLGLLSKLRQAFEAELPRRLENLKRLEELSSRNATLLSGIDTQLIESQAASSSDLSIAMSLERAENERDRAAEGLSDVKAEYAQFSNERKRSETLARELRDLAARILRASGHADECPLCHTKFGEGELDKHINRGLDEHVENKGRELLQELHALEVAVERAIKTCQVLSRLKDYCKRGGLSVDTPLGQVLHSVSETREEQVRVEAELASERGQVATLEQGGVSGDVLREQLARLQERGVSVSEHTVKSLQNTIKEVTDTVESLAEERKQLNSEALTLTELLGDLLPGVKGGASEFKESVSRLKERAAISSSLATKLSSVALPFPWSEERPLGELGVEVRTLRAIAGELKAAIVKESEARTLESESIAKRSEYESQLNDLSPRVERLGRAKAVLDELREKHSLASAVESALRVNKDSIAAIFSRIHSPAEFSGLGAELTTLVRSEGEDNVPLSQISTGQRAAYALSLFLAQNAQLRSAPPVILIDDPVSHVDDLNALSFLDYLRDLVLQKNKQIFFSTASAKLAALIERKFDFLGPEEFRRYDLERGEAVNPVSVR